MENRAGTGRTPRVIPAGSSAGDRNQAEDHSNELKRRKISQTSPGAMALVVASDISRFMVVEGGEVLSEDWSFAEPSSGAGAAAILIGESPGVFQADAGANGYYGYEVMDTCRPIPDSEAGDADLSLLSYLDCCEQSYLEYARRVNGVDYRDTFDYLSHPFRRHDKCLGFEEIEDPGDDDILFQSAVFLGLFYFIKGRFVEAVKFLRLLIRVHACRQTRPVIRLINITLNEKAKTALISRTAAPTMAQNTGTRRSGDGNAPMIMKTAMANAKPA